MQGERRGKDICQVFFKLLLCYFIQSDIKVNGCILCLNAVVLGKNRDYEFTVSYPCCF